MTELIQISGNTPEMFWNFRVEITDAVTCRAEAAHYGTGREDVIGQVGCLRPVVKKKLFMINIKLDVAIKVMI